MLSRPEEVNVRKWTHALKSLGGGVENAEPALCLWRWGFFDTDLVCLWSCACMCVCVCVHVSTQAERSVGLQDIWDSFT